MSFSSLLALVLLVFILVMLVLFLLIGAIRYEVTNLATTIAKPLLASSLSITISLPVALLLYEPSKISNNECNLFIGLFFFT
jgi:hypothetical protein